MLPSSAVTAGTHDGWESAVALGINLQPRRGQTGRPVSDRRQSGRQPADQCGPRSSTARTSSPFEHEHIPTTMEEAARLVVSVPPRASALLYAQDKPCASASPRCGIPCPAWARVRRGRGPALKNSGVTIDGPIVVLARHDGQWHLIAIPQTWPSQGTASAGRGPGSPSRCEVAAPRAHPSSRQVASPQIDGVL